jgi:diguanylate cyclase (GGDEF)-like protein/PAS domain S-box-containing protein
MIESAHMNASHVAARVPTSAWYLRLHRALMPDYNRKAALYWWTMVLLGTAGIGWALGQIGEFALDAQLQVVVGTLIAMIAGGFPVKIPRSKSSFAAGEIFIFLLLLMHGPAAAALASAGEAAIGSARTSTRWSSRIASPTMAALAMLIAGSLFTALMSALKSYGLHSEGVLLTTSMLFAVAYFLLNTLFVTLVLFLKRNERIVWREWIGSFGWVGISYAGTASVAALLFLTFQQFGVGVLLAALPIIAMLLTTLHYYFRQQETEEQGRRTRVEAAEREAEQAARHAGELRDSEQRFHSAFTHASIGMALVSVDGAVLQINAALTDLLGYGEGQVVGRRLRDLVNAEDVALLDERLRHAVEHDDDKTSVELRCRHRDGSEVWVALHCAFFSDFKSSAPCLIVQAQDITARRSAEARLHHIAYHDALTNLPNRGRFNERLQQAIERSQASPSHQFAVLFLDFDRFKIVNDSLGHRAGDEFLVQVARRILEHVRGNDVVARLGGDEFAILVNDIDANEQAIALAERLQQALRTPFSIGGSEISTSASIGITFSGFGYRTPDDVLRDADIAMYRAKTQGKARHAVFDASLHAQVTEQLHLENDLRRAIDNDQLLLQYQPIYRLADGKLVACEALVRWNHPVRGLIPPATFIPVAEECGLIAAISDWALEQGCRQLRAWRDVSADLADITLHVNISGFELCQVAFAERVMRTLVRTGVAPQQLTLEITESILMDRLESARESMAYLRQLGVALSVDDFGTGYSSLSYLSRLPITSLKIDASFVQKIESNASDAEVVRAIVTLGRSLKKVVIAEGVETAEQLARLRELGCELGQGFYLSRPLPGGEFVQLPRVAPALEGVAERASEAKVIPLFA